jgi:hypothetical protein
MFPILTCQSKILSWVITFITLHIKTIAQTANLLHELPLIQLESIFAMS